MTAHFLEQLPTLIVRARRQSQRIFDARVGRNRARAVVTERVCARDDSASHENVDAARLILGEPALAIASLLSAQADAANDGATSDGTPPAAMVVIDLAGEGDADANGDRWLSPWLSALELARRLVGDDEAALAVHVRASGASALRLVLEALWNATTIEARHAVSEPRLSHVDPAHAVVFCSNDAAWLERAIRAAPGPWIACTADPAVHARLRAALIARGTLAFSCESVGNAPADWARRQVGPRGKQLAMSSALSAFGATPLVATSTDMLLGERMRDGVSTLVWVDPPDRETQEATLCRALTRRMRGGWARVVVLAWHVAPTLGQALAVRTDAPIDVLQVRCLPRAADGEALRVDPAGFDYAVPAGAVVACARLVAGGAEWLEVEWPRGAVPPADWSIDPDHAGDVFRAEWHALREPPGATVRSVRLRLPWRATPRRVCVRSVDAAGRVSDIVQVVHHAQALRTALPAPALRTALC
jgi:hypothetical protein